MSMLDGPSALLWGLTTIAYKLTLNCSPSASPAPLIFPQLFELYREMLTFFQHSRHDKWQERPHPRQILQSQWPRGCPSEVGRSGPCNQKLASYQYHLSKESLVFLSSWSVLENLDMFYWTRVLYGSIPIAFKPFLTIYIGADGIFGSSIVSKEFQRQHLNTFSFRIYLGTSWTQWIYKRTNAIRA